MSGNTSPGLESDASKSYCEDLTTIEIKGKITSGAFKLSDKEGRSKVWALYSCIEDEDGNRLPNIVACKICHQIFKGVKGSTSNLARHKCYMENKDEPIENLKQIKPVYGGQYKERILKLFIEWIVEDCRPLEIIEDEGFRNYFSAIIDSIVKNGKNLTMDKIAPKENELNRDLSRLYGTRYEKLKSEISSQTDKGFTLSLPLYEDVNFSFSLMPVVMHSVKDGRITSNYLGLRKVKREPSSDFGARMQKEIEDLLNSYDCQINEEVLLITNRRQVAKQFSKNYSVVCINHLFNEVLEKCIKKVQAISQLHEKCCCLMKILMETEPGFDSSFQKEKMDSRKWTCMYYVFDYIETNWTKINEVKKTDESFLSSVSDIAKIFKFFEDALKKLEETSLATIHLVVVYVHNLKKLCQPYPNDTESVKAFRLALGKEVEALLLPNLTHTHKVALYLFPPAKKLLTLEENEKVLVKQACQQMIEVFIAPKMNQKNNSHQAKRGPKSSKAPTKDQILKEMETYEALQSPFYKNFDILQWWYTHKINFPHLFELSRWIHSIPATCIISKDIFTKTKNLVLNGPYDIETDQDYINYSIFLNYNMKETISQK